MQTQGPYEGIDWNYLLWLTIYFEKKSEGRERERRRREKDCHCFGVLLKSKVVLNPFNHKLYWESTWTKQYHRNRPYTVPADATGKINMIVELVPHLFSAIAYVILIKWNA